MTPSYDWLVGPTSRLMRAVRVGPVREWRALGRDLLLGIIVIVGLWLTVVPSGEAGRGLQLGLASAAVVSLLSRRRWPSLSVAGTATTTGSAWVLGLTADPFVLTGLCLFAVAELRVSRRVPWWLLAASGLIGLTTLGFSAEGVEVRFRGVMLGVIVLSASWSLGVRTREVRYEAALRSRVDERRRLARDVHDVLSHSLGTIGVRAGVAAHVSTLGSTGLRTVLHEIENEARVSLSELKSLMRRERTGDLATVESETATSLSLAARLDGLTRSAERSGLSTVLEVDGDMKGLSTTTQTTVHRLVQEAVTNTIRHASAATLAIGVQMRDGRVDIEVRDDGHGAGLEVCEGNGLMGMRERVAMVGGMVRFETSPGGFSVLASVPESNAEDVGGRP